MVYLSCTQTEEAAHVILNHVAKIIGLRITTTIGWFNVRVSS